MGFSSISVPAAGALAVLADSVRLAKGDDPLAPVTIIVPTNAVGVTARRWLGANGGIAAIEMVTPARLAERVAGAELAAAGRRPVSTPLIDITVRAVLDAVPGAYAAVARHPSTITSLRDLYRELRVARPGAIDRLRASSARGGEAARVSSMVAERLAHQWYDEADLLALAIERIDAGRVPFEHAVALLPQPEPGLVGDLLSAVGRCADLHIIVDHTGVAAVDDETRAFIDAVGGAPSRRADTTFPPRSNVSVVSTTDADEEVRHATRRLVDAARAGTPFARMAIVWPVDRPYARLVEHHLDIAGVPWNGRPGTLVTERLVPRFLLDLLRLDRRGLRRHDVFDFLADLPIRGLDGHRISVARWERVARLAGVSREEHWAPRLNGLSVSLRARVSPREHDAAAADQLAAFIADLRSDLGSSRRTRTWQQWADWCERQVMHRLGRSILDQLDEPERLASDHTSKVLDRLRYLDVVSPPVTRSDFRAAFEAEFDAAPGRVGRLGTGVTIGSLAGTVGLDADLTIMLGAAEGLLPPAPATDPLVTDADRRTAGLPDAVARVHRVHRSFLSHLTTSHEVVVSVPRGDLRSTTERLASRWIPEHLPDAPQRAVSSHQRGLLTSDFPSALTEHRLRRLATAATIGTAALTDACADDVVASRGLAMRAARRAATVTVYDGDLSSVTVDHFDRPVSASRIEAWPACPHAYFMRHLLGVYPLDDPSDELALSPMERGNVLHETLDRFHHLVMDGTLPQPDERGWLDEHLDALDTLFDEVAGQFERSGRTGRAAHWFLDRRDVLAQLHEWFRHDRRWVASRGAHVTQSELRFGYDEPVTLPLPDGRRLRVAGFVDRVDVRTDGDLIVTDHKTGDPKYFGGITADDPTEAGQKFQLPVYAAAALAARGEEAGSSGVQVLAEYGFFGKGNYQRLGYTFDAAVWDRVTTALGEVVAGIESGLYPAVTEPPKFEFFIRCRYCQPDGLGVDERYREWHVKQHDPRLVRWFEEHDDVDA
ncbi:MAG: PD-(D/E)XK nuclease family protein [Ilumatobacteraceae bacterium]